jgi:flavin reductase (DIM6/NTAB) family NADH-FMN oxidoreductase RutF
MEFDPSDHTGRQNYQLLSGMVVPRPIAFVTSLSADGLLNAAPFAYFNAIANNPPLVMFSPTYQGAEKPDYSGEKVKKDTLRNIEETGEFVINIATEDIAEAINICAGTFGPEINELEKAGLTTLPSRVVKPPRVAESPGALECRLERLVDLGSHNLVIGQVVMFHLRDDLFEDGTVDVERLRPIARLSKNNYTRCGDIFEMLRPK